MKRFVVTGEDGSVLSYGASTILPENATELESNQNPPVCQPGFRLLYASGVFSCLDCRTSETEWILVRAERDRLLQASDWTQLPDVPLVTKEAWAVYRQALRDVTLQPDPFNITWPVAPG